jgi:adenylate cyclase
MIEGLDIDFDSTIAEMTVPGFSGRPAVAVLPFETVAGDGAEEYFADGITEDLITRLSSWRSFPVIARNSSFVYRGPGVDQKRVSQELGVRYLVEGSVCRAGDRVRISARLSDAVADQVVWAASSERELFDIFVTQQEISGAVAEAIEPGIRDRDPDLSHPRPLPKFDAWDCALRGVWHLHRLTKTDNLEARSLLERAIQLAPDLVLAYWGLVVTHYLDLQYEWTASPEETVSETMRVAEIGAVLDTRDHLGHMGLALAHGLSGKPDEAVSSLELVLQLNPSLSTAHYILGLLLGIGDDPDAGLPRLRTAMRLSPLDPELPVFMAATALVHFAAERYEEAAAWAQRSIDRRPGWSRAYRMLASSYAHLGRLEDARRAFNQGRRLQPEFSQSATWLLAASTNPGLMDRFFSGLRRAGWRD